MSFPAVGKKLLEGTDLRISLTGQHLFTRSDDLCQSVDSFMLTSDGATSQHCTHCQGMHLTLSFSGVRPETRVWGIEEHRQCSKEVRQERSRMVSKATPRSARSVSHVP